MRLNKLDFASEFKKKELDQELNWKNEIESRSEL